MSTIIDLNSLNKRISVLWHNSSTSGSGGESNNSYIVLNGTTPDTPWISFDGELIEYGNYENSHSVYIFSSNKKIANMSHDNGCDQNIFITSSDIELSNSDVGASFIFSTSNQLLNSCTSHTGKTFIFGNKLTMDGCMFESSIFSVAYSASIQNSFFDGDFVSIIIGDTVNIDNCSSNGVRISLDNYYGNSSLFVIELSKSRSNFGEHPMTIHFPMNTLFKGNIIVDGGIYDINGKSLLSSPIPVPVSAPNTATLTTEEYELFLEMLEWWKENK